jgi:hypothetical protein
MMWFFNAVWVWKNIFWGHQVESYHRKEDDLYPNDSEQMQQEKWGQGKTERDGPWRHDLKIARRMPEGRMKKGRGKIPCTTYCTKQISWWKDHETRGHPDQEMTTEIETPMMITESVRHQDEQPPRSSL